MDIAVVSQKGWIVIPKRLRRKYQLKAGSRVALVEYQNVLVLVPLPQDPLKALYGLAAGTDLLAAWREEKRQLQRSEVKPT